MTVKGNPNFILQITASVTARTCAVRLTSEDVSLSWELLLERYLKSPPFDELLEDQRITPESARSLSAIQDLAYVSDDDGRLHDLFPGTNIKQGDQTLAPGMLPELSLGRAGDIEVELKKYVNDITNWRKMLSGTPILVNLVDIK